MIIHVYRFILRRTHLSLCSQDLWSKESTHLRTPIRSHGRSQQCRVHGAVACCGPRSCGPSMSTLWSFWLKRAASEREFPAPSPSGSHEDQSSQHLEVSILKCRAKCIVTTWHKSNIKRPVFHVSSLATSATHTHSGSSTLNRLAMAARHLPLKKALRSCHTPCGSRSSWERCWLVERASAMISFLMSHFFHTNLHTFYSLMFIHYFIHDFHFLVISAPLLLCIFIMYSGSRDMA